VPLLVTLTVTTRLVPVSVTNVSDKKMMSHGDKMRAYHAKLMREFVGIPTLEEYREILCKCADATYDILKEQVGE